MKKEIYTGVVLSFTMFEDENIITASVVESTTRDPNKPIELPFVPAEK